MKDEPTINELLTAIRKHRDQRGQGRSWDSDRELYVFLPEGLGESDPRNRLIDELELSRRVRGVLESLDCLTVGDVLQHSALDFLMMKNFGETSLSELEQQLARFNCRLRPGKHEASSWSMARWQRIRELEDEVHRLKSKCARFAGYVRHARTCPGHPPVKEGAVCNCGLVEIFADVNTKLKLPPKDT